MGLRGAAYASRRIRQSFTHFDNGPQVLWDTLRGREMTFRTRTGLTIHAPSVDGARFPVYEITADDVYRLDELLAGLRPDLVAVDIGAHIGSFSTAVCAAVPGATVHAYEASPSTAAWLERNVTANSLGDRLVVHRRAVSDHEGDLEIVDNGEASAHNGLTAPDGSGSVVSVPCVTFADIHAETGGTIDLVKSDAEGAEYGVILTSDPAHWATVQRVVMEYHPVDGYELDDLVRFLGAVGLDLVRHEPADRPGLGNAWFARGAGRAAA
ncbi:FkbM family methyltransferase [Aeromicrobium sp. CFBP 8757]|uniref:FkbM family methyltransferase n=1 Tax=Aeromicrobium sp. CFBP 8757 TaxID=2775288 RepID=UPI00177ACB2C|nr:FkbM family methyltransferase [Aeromicrobium sp. CFBP 8757]MBD8606992.1 FkbM family methyltransferase [Aeromicrobium sp. CFBP 8757]